MRSDSGSRARVHSLVGDRGFWNRKGLAEVAPIVEIMSSEGDHGGGSGRRAVLAEAMQSESDQLAKTVLLACHSPTAIELAQQKHRTCPCCAKKSVRFQEGTPTPRSESARRTDSTDSERPFRAEFPGSAERHGDANSQQYPLRVECVGVQTTDLIAFRT